MKLKQIAQAMKAVAQTTGDPTRHRLSRGLTLTLSYNQESEEWKLSLTRWATQASGTERAICKQAFGIPPETKPEHDYKDGWGIARYAWAESTVEQLSFESVESVREG